MAILSKHAVICLESIVNKEERALIKKELTDEKLNENPFTIIDISIHEMENMCGNVLGVSNKFGEMCCVMSKKAADGYSADNWDVIWSNYRVV